VAGWAYRFVFNCLLVFLWHGRTKLQQTTHPQQNPPKPNYSTPPPCCPVILSPQFHLELLSPSLFKCPPHTKYVDRLPQRFFVYTSHGANTSLCATFSDPPTPLRDDQIPIQRCTCCFVRSGTHVPGAPVPTQLPDLDGPLLKTRPLAQCLTPLSSSVSI